MLQAIRDRAHGIFAWIMLIAIGVPFGLWGIQNYLDTGKERPAAVVGEREIFDREVSQAYEQSLASLVGVADYDEKQLKHQALERLIREELIAQNAEDKSLVVTDAEIRSFIQELPYFKTDGRFDREKYTIMLSAQGLTSDQFVGQVRRALLMEQYQRSISDSVFVTGDQIETLLRLKNQEREIEYATIPLKLSNHVFPDAEIEAYYREHAADFRNPARVSVEYIALSLEDMAKSVQVSEEDLHRLYEEQKAGFGTEERRRVSHILVSIESPGEEAETSALTKITQIRERLMKGEDFAKVARETSGDPVSAKQGGDFGFIDKSTEENFAKAALALALGGISEPVKTPFGYHLIKLTEVIPANTKSFEEVKDELRNAFQHNTAENKFYELGQILTEQAYEHPDSLEPAASKLNLRIEHTELFTRETGEGLAAEPAVRASAFSEEVLNGRNSEPVELGNEKAVVLRLKEHRPESDRPLIEVREEIVARLRKENARLTVGKQVEELVKQVREGRSLAEAAKSLNLSVTKPPALRRGAEGLPPALLNAVFTAPRPVEGGEAAPPQSIELENGDRIVFSLLAVKDGAPSPEGGDKERDSVREFLLKTEGQRELASFVARLREFADVRQLKPES